MRNVRFATICGLFAFAASLLFARVHPFGDAGLYKQAQANPIMQQADIPSNVRQTLMTKCADCHSAQTRAPLYGRMAPFSWLMEHDILEAREAMNLSRWNNYAPEQQEAFKTKIFLEAKAHRMPLPQYRIIHWNARITDADLHSLSQWAHQSTGASNSPLTPAAGEGDAARGKDIFERRCTGCHSLDQNREGPRLRGVFGRTSGSLSDFDYSTALKQAHITWNETSLERWLTDPDTLVPGNNMEFHVAKPQERIDLIRFLKENAIQ
jgi:cytochrome c